MILHKKCPVCGSTNLTGYAIDCSRNGPHISRVICKDCSIVFANPMADFDELYEFYQFYYDKRNFGKLNYKERISKEINKINGYSERELNKKAAHIYNYKRSGNFLDIGCGLGIGFLYASKYDFKLYGTEFDTDAINFIHQNFNAEIFHGDLLQAGYPDNFFDYVYFNHVIEHVLDPRQYLEEIYRIMKPGGVMNIGTPNISSSLYTVYRKFKLLTLSIPKTADGIEHTFLFNKKTLSNICRETGFEILDHKKITLGETWSNIINSDLSLRQKISRYVQTKFHVNQELTVQKPVTGN